MKVKIDDDGYLYRQDTWKKMPCPFRKRDCCDDCPAFHHYPKNEFDPEYIELKCFPQQVKFEVEL